MLLLLTVGASALVVLGAPPALRAPIVLPYLLVVPGLAWVRLLRMRSFASVATLSIALAMAIDTLVAAAMIAAGVWSAEVGVVAIGVVTLVPLLAGSRR